MFIQTEETPNPLTLKFIPEKKIMDSGFVEFKNKEEATNNELAKNLFLIDGIDTVSFGEEFISITKSENSDWMLLKADVLCVLVDYLSTNNNIIDTVTDGNEINDNDDEVVKQIKILINERIRPGVAQDGGDVVFSSFKEGILELELRGACSGCPSASVTLKMGIENMMRHYIPEVLEVREAS